MGGHHAQQAKVKVIVRVRPLLPHEPNTPCAAAVDSKHVRLLIPQRTQSYGFKYDSCYDTDSIQEAIYEKEIQPIVSSLFEGLNTTVFAYGNTGAGKTFTMQGSEEQPGIIPRVAESIIELLKKNPKATLHMSYVELYNERLYDLLVARGNDLAIREDKSKNILIPDLTEVQIKSVAGFKQFFDTGCKNRSTGATKLNPNSSRSHAILMFKVQVTQPNTVLTGKFNLIDLAGSEDNRKTGNKGIRLTESSNINQSLFVLGNVVNSLNSGLSRIPYRDSKLTRILQDSLGGTSNAVMIANIAPTAAYYSDTLNTLNFALKSKNITNKPTVHSTEIVSLPPPTAVTAELSHERKQQLEAWKKGKNPQSNKENQENFAEQLEKFKQEVKQEMKKEVYSIEAKLQQFLSNQMSFDKLTEQLRRPIIQDTTLQPIDLPKNLSAMTPCSKMSKIKQLLALANQLVSEWAYPQAIEVYQYIVPHLDEKSYKEKALNRIAFLQICLNKSFTPGSYKHKAMTNASDSNATSCSIDEGADKSDESESSGDLSSAKEESPTIAQPLPLANKSSQPQNLSNGAKPKPKPAPISANSSAYASPPSSPLNQGYHTTYVSRAAPAIPETDIKVSKLDLSKARLDDPMETQQPKAAKPTKVDLEKQKAEQVKAQKSDKTEKAEKVEKSAEIEEKPQQTEKAKKEKREKRYISSDEDYDDGVERKKKAVKKQKKAKEVVREVDDSEFWDTDVCGDKETRILAVLNSGDKKALLLLSGVGDKRANKIMDFRANGSFTRLSDLRNLSFSDKLISSMFQTPDDDIVDV